MVTGGPKTEVVLVGGGHSHVQLLRRLAMFPVPDLRLTVVLDTPIAIYSGMVPGFIAGQYRTDELEIDVVPLARRAGAQVILSPATSVEAAASLVHLKGRPPIRYDFASLDVGSMVAGLDVPGVREHALPGRPISRFVLEMEAFLDRDGGDAPGKRVRLVVVGAGAGGVEVAFTLRERLRSRGLDVDTTLIDGGSRILPGSPNPLVRRVECHATAREIKILCDTEVTRVGPGRVLAGSGEIEFDLLAWVTDAVGPSVLRRGDLPLGPRGFVRTRSTLQVVGYDNLFAVGDCATLEDYPETAKAGVFAVRQGPFLIDNLLAATHGGSLRTYRPQGEFLALLNLGDGAALGSKWGRSFEGRWVWRLKDWIDRRFVARFQVLDDDGSVRTDFPEMKGEQLMLCGGCAAKVGQSPLERALGRLGDSPPPADVLLGIGAGDDAAVFRTPRGDLVAATVDLFPAFTEDPFLVGRVAAFNALSDLLATGVEPRHALAIIAVPEEARPDEAEEILFQCLSGARSALDEVGVSLLGGHTTTSSKLMAGFAMDGLASGEASLLRLNELEPGHRLILTKPLGTGVMFHADMLGLLPGRWLSELLEAVQRSNVEALRVIREVGGRGVTDVTGFGLAGHLGEMVRSSRVAVEMSLSSVPVLSGALQLLRRGLRSTFHEQNEEGRQRLLVEDGFDEAELAILFDPQTAGGLLFGVDEGRAEEAVERLRTAGDATASVIGVVLEGGREGPRLAVRS